MDKHWETGFTTPLKAKLALFLLSFFAVLGFGLTGYKMGSIAPITIAVFLCVLLWGTAFRKSWFHIDELHKTVTIKTRFFLTWRKTLSYRGKFLTESSSRSISQDHGSRGSGSNEIYLTERHATKGELIFSSNVSEDYFRVIEYLGTYITVK
ncbi:hypothetical protein PVT68_06180 [Microbulbifer bruguierae]|uniref:PH domain-containing protein n=1 Tax=Microbulbifer bruguierae TaxID=3029061 RepID=A0ABY8NG23_9GAMM|nr:hypothetical protein [Microbulbifer bruguierae]WGL17881.1 hypothetical protein PVT68_06180 [Microbulbifer bruguierae]